MARPDPGTDVDTIMRAFCDVFEDCSLWNATPFDLMLVGTATRRGPVTDAQFAAAWQNPTLQARLREVGFEQPEQIGATFVGDADYVRRLTAGTPPLTDDFPHRLIPVAGRASLSDPRYATDAAVAARYQSVFDPSRARDAFRASPLVRNLWPSALAERSLPLFDRQRVINRVIWEGGKPLAQIEDLDSVLTGSTLRTLPLWILGSDEVKQQIAESVNDGTGTTEYRARPAGIDRTRLQRRRGALRAGRSAPQAQGPDDRAAARLCAVPCGKDRRCDDDRSRSASVNRRGTALLDMDGDALRLGQ